MGDRRAVGRFLAGSLPVNMNPLPVFRGFRESLDPSLRNAEPFSDANLTASKFFQRIQVVQHHWGHRTLSGCSARLLALSAPLVSPPVCSIFPAPTWQSTPSALHPARRPVAACEPSPKRRREMCLAKLRRLHALESRGRA